MSGKVKVRDESAKGDQVRHALKQVPTNLDKSALPQRAASILLDRNSQCALAAELGSRNEDAAVAALAAVCAQHLSDTRLDEPLLAKVDEVAGRLLTRPSRRWQMAERFACQMLVLKEHAQTKNFVPCRLNTSEFLQSLAALETAALTLGSVAIGMLPMSKALSRLERQGKTAMGWAGAFLNCAVCAAPAEQRAELVLAMAEAMLRSGQTDLDVAHLLVLMVSMHPETADALLALEEIHESIALVVLIAFCVARPELATCAVVRDRTSEIAWMRLLREIREPVTTSMERIVLVRRTVLHHAVGRDVSRVLNPLLELHPTNRCVVVRGMHDDEVANEIEVLAKVLGRDIVPTRLGWAS
jgi:hypothetical protein